jgi:very-short-patch-repair endonuclease
MKLGCGSSFLCFTAVRSVSFILQIPVKKYLWNCFSRSAHVIMEFTGREENQAKADPERDNGNK